MRPIALVFFQRYLVETDFLRFFVHDAHAGRYWHNLIGKCAGLLSRRRTLLTLQAILILLFAADVVALANNFCGFQHRHVDIGCGRSDVFIRSAIAIVVLILYQANRFNTPGDDDRHIIVQYLLGGRGNRHQSGGALPIDRHSRNRDGQSGREQALTGNVLTA